jgi:PAP2 superfamily
MLLLLLVAPACADRDPAEPSDVRATPLAGEVPHRGGNPVTHWTTVAIDLMKDPGPVIDGRAFAILHAAIHDAVNGVERRFQPYTADLSLPGASLEAAVATAARDILIALSPTQRERIEAEYAAALNEVADGAAKAKGVTLGRRSAKANLARRSKDGIPVGPWPPREGPITQPVYVPNGKPGDYAFTPPFDAPPLGPIALFPGLGRLEPFVIESAKYRLPGPDPLRSPEYAKDLNYLRSIGRLHSSRRTPDQTEIARFWFEPFFIWQRAANDVIERKGLGPWRAARILALMHFAMFDAGIACFEAKYRYRFWRPYTAIRRADEDGNPDTHPGAHWLPLLWPEPGVDPPQFLIPPIPEYPSAAATISGAAAEVLTRHLGDQVSFEATSVFLPGVTRRFRSFTHAAEEAGMSRVYGGIHFVRAVRDGHRLGKGIGAEVSPFLSRVRP